MFEMLELDLQLKLTIFQSSNKNLPIYHVAIF